MLVIDFNQNGQGRCLYSEILPLNELGSLEMARASMVEFNPTSQHWEVQVNGEIIFSDFSRKVCLDFEHTHFNQF